METKNIAAFYRQIDDYTALKIPYFFVIDFEQKTPLLYTFDQLQAMDSVWFTFPNGEYRTPRELNYSVIPQIIRNPISIADYKHQFDLVMCHLNRGDSFLTNLTCETPITLEGDIQSLYRQVSAKYKICVKNQFVCFSPETFIKISRNRVTTYPMKGTIDASIVDAENKLLNDPKETAEHATIVDLLRNDLSIVAHDVKVERYRYFDRIKTGDKELLQMSSEIKGIILNQYKNRFGSIMQLLLPAGSISGAPKKKTLEIIHEVETHKRSYYSGVCGYFDGKNLDSCVTIRYIEQRGDNFYYKSGGGITFMSKMEDEYQEMKNKVYVPVD